MGMNGLAGVSGVLYALCTIGGILKDNSLVEEAAGLAKKFSTKMLEGKNSIELMSGMSGTVLALAKISTMIEDKEISKIIEKLGEGIWSREFMEKIEEKEGTGSNNLSGLSHGLAGAVLAASCVSRISSDGFSGYAADKIMQLESARFSEDQMNWPDRRKGQQVAFHDMPCQWCHGAVGIGMSRLVSLKAWPESKTSRRDIDRAVGAVMSRKLRPVDHVCCGNFGQIEFLHDAAEALNRDDIRAEALARTVTVISRARETGSYAWPVGGNEYNVGFFNGISGIGYTLIKINSRNYLPSISTMQ